MALCHTLATASRRVVQRMGPTTAAVGGATVAAAAALVALVIAPLPAVSSAAVNVIVVNTDDQDLLLGGISNMPQLRGLLEKGGTTFDNGFVTSPVCCVSRSETLSGRYAHNIIVQPGQSGCMQMNTASADWKNNSLAAQIKRQGLGVTTGLFGKYLNSHDQFMPPGNVPPGWDKFAAFVGYAEGFFNNTWNIDGSKVTLPGYETAVLGNATAKWIKDHVASKGTDAPFFAYVAPHAPHIADGIYPFTTTPAPWHANVTLPSMQAPRTPAYRFNATSHHWVTRNQPPMNDATVAWTDLNYVQRQRALLAVDDMVQGIADALKDAGVFENTYIFYTSDHGWSLGTYNQPSGKWQATDTHIKVPFLVTGPGVPRGAHSARVVGNVDIAATVIDLLGGDATKTNFDGRSFADVLRGGTGAQRDALLIEYWGLVQGPVLPGTTPGVWRGAPSSPNCAHGEGACNPACGADKCFLHLDDLSNNTYIGLRVVNTTHNLLYVEYYPSNQEREFDVSSVTEREFFDLTEDPYQLHNTVHSTPQAVLNELSARLHQQYGCKGSSCG